jgi:hypothetical protein
MSVQIAINNYDDLFSDFDIRDYSERYISSDFLNELRMRANRVKKKNGIEVIFLIDEDEKKIELESIIVERLRLFFIDRYERNKKKKKQILFNMLVFEIIGIAFLFLANYLEEYTFVFLKEFLLIPSWFFIWNGLEKFINNNNIIDRNIQYYSKLVKSRILFKTKELITCY